VPRLFPLLPLLLLLAPLVPALRLEAAAAVLLVLLLVAKGKEVAVGEGRAGDHGGDAGSTVDGEKGDGSGSPGGGPLIIEIGAAPALAVLRPSCFAPIESPLSISLFPPEEAFAFSNRARICRLVPVAAMPAVLAACFTAAIESLRLTALDWSRRLALPIPAAASTSSTVTADTGDVRACESSDGDVR